MFHLRLRFKLFVAAAIFGFSICAIILICFQNGFSSIKKIKQPILNTNFEDKFIIRENFYSDFQKRNFSVVDYFFNNEAIRSLKFIDHAGDLSIVSLKNISNKLIVDRKDVKAIYYRGMLMAPFMVNPSIKNYSPNMSVLFLGLGGGAMTNFLSNHPNAPNITVVEIDPTIKEIAIKWFDVKENSKTRVIIKNGIDFIKNTNEKFDAIMVDACTPDFKSPILCPASDFLKGETILHFSSKLKTGGVFTSNIAVTQTNQTKILVQILKNYSKYFKTCFLITANNNFVLTCSNDATFETIKKFKLQQIPLPLQRALFSDFSFYNV